MTLKLVFMGTPDFSVPVLEALMAAGHEIVCAYSQPPRKSGRGMRLHKSPVHDFAARAGIPVRTPASLKGADEQAAFAALSCDAAVVVAYGLLLPPGVLAAPRHGCFNVHASLLPRWRGAAPIQRAIMAGDKQSGVSIMKMGKGLDDGPVCRVVKTAIDEHTTAQDLHDELSRLGAKAMTETLAQLEAGALVCQPQPETGVTWAKKIGKDEARIDFDRNAAEVLCHIHGLSPFPGAWFSLGIDGRAVRIKVLEAETVSLNGEPGTILDDNFAIACKDKAIRPLRLQREGKGAMDVMQFMHGNRISAGEKVN